MAGLNPCRIRVHKLKVPNNYNQSRGPAMYDVLGQKFIFAVAQKPFETVNQTGIYNQFCALLPLFDVSGNPVPLSDFPDHGDVWWMVLPQKRGLAEPGRLVTGLVEDSVKKGQPGLAQYQVVADSVEPIRGRDYVEVLDVPAGAAAKPRDFGRPSFRLSCDHVPLDTVYLRWRSNVYGPLKANSEVSDAIGAYWIRFDSQSSDSSVLEFSADCLGKLAPSTQIKTSIQVAWEQRPLHESSKLASCTYHIVETESLEQVIPLNCPRVSILSDEQVLGRLAKQFLTRSKKQSLQKLLEELGLQSADTRSLDENEVLLAIRDSVQNDLVSTQTLAEALVDTGILDSQLQDAIRARTDQYISDNSTRLASEINQKIDTTRIELESLKTSKSKLDSDIAKDKQTAKRALDEELKQRKNVFDGELSSERETLQKQADELNRQKDVLKNNLLEVGKKLSEQRDEVVNQFLTISPLLSQLGLIPNANQTLESRDTRRALDVSRESFSDAATDECDFEFPSFKKSSRSTSITEVAFFERFTKHVRDSGFQYRDIDLLTFHVSTKCGDLTVLGGLPGTGKSTLTRLYSEAVMGEELYKHDNRQFLHIAVSPAWLDMRDLIGHVNALNGTFHPADSGLYQKLLVAEQEYRELADDSTLHFICLDELNLSHVEHYFSAFLQVLEHPNDRRILQCFPENVVRKESTFGSHSSINLPPTLRFVGTVNFDETTKQLSQRLLDRTNMIRLPSEILPLELEDPSTIRPSGEAVRLRDYANWTKRSATYSEELGTILDELKVDLRVLGCPMNPRRFSAMRRFIASWPKEIRNVSRAIDLQIAQRVFPQIRSTFQPQVRSAVESIRRKLESKGDLFSESLRVLSDVVQGADLEGIESGDFE